MPRSSRSTSHPRRTTRRQPQEYKIDFDTDNEDESKPLLALVPHAVSRPSDRAATRTSSRASAGDYNNEEPRKTPRATSSSPDFEEERRARELKNEREYCDRDVKLVRIVLALAAAIFPVTLGHRWHLVGANCVFCYDQYELAIAGWMLDASLTAPALPEFCCSVITILLFFATHYLIHSAARARGRGSNSQSADGPGGAGESLEEGARPGAGARTRDRHHGAKKQPSSGLVDRLSKTFGAKADAKSFSGEDEKSSRRSATSPYTYEKRWSSQNLSRLSVVLTIMIVIAVLGLCISVYAHLRVSGNVDLLNRYNQPLKTPGPAGLPYFTTSFLGASYLIYFVFLVIIGIVYYLLYGVRERLRNCEKAEGKQERARKRYVQAMEEREIVEEGSALSKEGKANRASLLLSRLSERAEEDGPTPGTRKSRAAASTTEEVVRAARGSRISLRPGADFRDEGPSSAARPWAGTTKSSVEVDRRSAAVAVPARAQPQERPPRQSGTSRRGSGDFSESSATSRSVSSGSSSVKGRETKQQPDYHAPRPPASRNEALSRGMGSLW